MSRRRRASRLVSIIGVALISHILATGLAKAEENNRDLDLYILVDESTSLSPTDVEKEREAVGNIVGLPGLIDQKIRVQILPFSSGPGSPRIVTGCELTELNEAGQRYLLNNCVGQIRREDKRYGVDAAGNTDFARAIEVALGKISVQQDQGRRQAILLLTDGKYDPDGDREVNSSEQNDLDRSLRQALDQEVQIWPLGFGDRDSIDLAALQRYASSGFLGRGDCPRPEAQLASPEALEVQIYEIVSGITCSSAISEPTPSEEEIHPLTNLLSVSVVGAQTEPTLQDPSGTIECAGGWVERFGSFECQLTLKESRPGTWRVVSSAGSIAVWRTSGKLRLVLEKCGVEATIRASRPDGSPVDWDLDFPWPEVKVSQSDSNGVGVVEPSFVTIDSLTKKISVDEDAKRIRLDYATLPRSQGLNQSDVRLLQSISLDEIAECDVAAGQSPTSSTPEGTSPSATPTSENPTSQKPDTGTGSSSQTTQPPADPKPPFALWLVLLIPLAALIFALRRLRGRGRFPEGSVIKQSSPNHVLLELSGDEIAGQRQVGLKKIAGSWRFEVSGKEDADYLLRRAGTSVEIVAIGDVDVGADETHNSKKAKLQWMSFPLNLRFRVDGNEFIVEVPDQFEDEETGGS